MTTGSGRRSATEGVYDAVVVGGGPGGSAAAIGCALRGLRAALVESREFPRPRPGESLHPGVEPLLRQLGVDAEVLAAGFPRHAGQRVTWGGPESFQAFGADERGPWLGFQALGSRFDTILLAKARELGVTVLQPCKALEPLTRGGRVVGVYTSAGEIHGRYVVDAAGSQHWLGRRMGHGLFCASPRLTVHYGYARGICPDVDEAPALVADDAGWTWVARVDEGLYHWSRLPFREAPRYRPAAPPELRALAPVGRPLGADVTWRLIPQAAGPGYFITGDAVSVLDPLSSRGVLKAIMSGMRVADLLAQLLKGRASERRAVQDYRHWVSSWFEQDTRRLLGLYGQLRHGPEWATERRQARQA